jgi:anti-anti-sigma factor
MTALSSYGAATPGHLHVDIRLEGRGTIVALTGELDIASAPELDRQLRELERSRPGHLVLDLSGLDFMDSSGIALLIRAQRAANTAGHELSLRPGPAQVQRLFELTGSFGHFTFKD